MSRTRIAAAALIVCLLAAAGVLGGCTTPRTTVSSSGASTVATPQASVEPTVATPLNTSGPITTPPTGSAERKALLDAAREKLGVTTSFYVYQLYVQGDTALGDIDPVAKNPNGRLLVAWERRNGVWGAIGASKFGSPAATAANTARALPSFSTELINKIDWSLKKPTVTTTTTTKSSESEASAKAKLAKAAQEWANKSMAGKGAPYKLTTIKVAQDTKGVWWGHVVVQPTSDASNSYEALNIWAKFEGGEWNGSIQDPEPPAPTTFFPASVISKLGL